MEEFNSLMQGFSVALTYHNLLFMLVGILLGVPLTPLLLRWIEKRTAAAIGFSMVMVGWTVLPCLRAAGVVAPEGQAALAWLLQRKSITAPIVSATSLKQLDDVLNATTLELDPESVAALDKASAPA